MVAHKDAALLAYVFMEITGRRFLVRTVAVSQELTLGRGTLPSSCSFPL